MYKSFIRALVSLSFLIYLVNCHGRLMKPTSRSEWCNSGDSRNITQPCNDRDWQYCDFISNQYYYRGGTCDVCGTNDSPKQNWWFAYNTKVTGPIKATYNSGSKIELTAHIGNHRGYMRVRLCKLNKPTDTVTLNCLNQNLLKIEAKTPSHAGQTYRIDDYTMNTPFIGVATEYDADFYAYLPPGLDCENCVLQWEWHTTDQVPYCRSKSGQMMANVYNAEYTDSPCVTQLFRTCADIRINRIANQPALKSTPFEIKNKEKIFSCIIHRNDRGGGPIKALTSQTVSESNATGMVCLMSQEHFESKNKDANYHKNTFCVSCYNNCFIGKTCPKECYCSWFKKYPEAARIFE